MARLASAHQSTFTTWAKMVERCTNPRHDAFPYYGLRGIAVCDRWRSFENFLADMGERPPGLTIDRIDSGGNYEPGNCRWATKAQQTANRRPPARKGALVYVKPPARAHADKTHCKNGHPFNEENTRRREGNQRSCRACNRNVHAARRERRVAA